MMKHLFDPEAVKLFRLSLCDSVTLRLHGTAAAPRHDEARGTALALPAMARPLG
jgi:hypothetical protein